MLTKLNLRGDALQLLAVCVMPSLPAVGVEALAIIATTFFGCVAALERNVACLATYYQYNWVTLRSSQSLIAHAILQQKMGEWGCVQEGWHVLGMT